jgi:branched-chain amino acid transport system substrate-binding protein
VKSMKHLVYIILVMLMALALVAACAPKPVGEGPVKFGALIPYTSLDQIAPPFMENAIELKLDEVGWKVAGRDVVLIKEDTGGDVAMGVDKTKKLVESDKVHGITGPLIAFVQLAVTKYLTPYKIPHILQTQAIYGPPGGENAFKMGGHNFFSPTGTFRANPYRLGIYAYEDLGYRTAAVIQQDMVGGDEFCGGFVDGFTAKGGKIVQTQRVPMGTMDYAPYVAALQDADCVAAWVIPPEMLVLTKQYYEMGKTKPFLIADATCWTESLMGALGDDSTKLLTAMFWYRNYDHPANKKFVEAYKSKYGVLPEYWAVASYTATQVFLEGVKDAKGDTSPEVLNDAIRNVKTDTPIGPVSFDKDGVGIGNMYIIKGVKADGGYEFEVVKTYKNEVMKSPTEDW